MCTRARMAFGSRSNCLCAGGSSRFQPSEESYHGMTSLSTWHRLPAGPRRRSQPALPDFLGQYVPGPFTGLPKDVVLDGTHCRPWENPGFVRKDSRTEGLKEQPAHQKRPRLPGETRPEKKWSFLQFVRQRVVLFGFDRAELLALPVAGLGPTPPVHGASGFYPFAAHRQVLPRLRCNYRRFQRTADVWPTVLKTSP